jgi:hypothetical protein
VIQKYDSYTGNGVVELGCQWVHGEEGNVVFSMASQYGLLMESLINYDVEKLVFIDSSGNIANRNTIEELYGILDGIYSSSKTNLVNYTGSLGDYFNHKYVGVFTFLPVDLVSVPSYLPMVFRCAMFPEYQNIVIYSCWK